MVIATTARTNRIPLFALLGANGAAIFLPGFLAGIFGGTLVDRTGYKRFSVLADSVSGVGIGAIPLLYHTVGLAFWQLLILVFTGALLEVPGLTARRAMLPELAELAGMRLERVNASFESVRNLAMLVGPAAAGLLVGLLAAGILMERAGFRPAVLLLATALQALALAMLFVPAFRELERPDNPRMNDIGVSPSDK
ncbi:MAG: hypothetical protein ACRDJW_07195 [Thermomicrobiales bacterium]